MSALGHGQPDRDNLTSGGVAPIEPFEPYAKKRLELAIDRGVNAHAILSLKASPAFFEAAQKAR